MHSLPLVFSIRLQPCFSWAAEHSRPNGQQQHARFSSSSFFSSFMTSARQPVPMRSYRAAGCEHEKYGLGSGPITLRFAYQIIYALVLAGEEEEWPRYLRLISVDLCHCSSLLHSL
ncbi:hypothetical protein F4777DRAFT_322889 [Nemania sp. FL0916]|nr:hypothetical protein F4777DRAFT_322889 [Nemania sp. FL0916]